MRLENFAFLKDCRIADFHDSCDLREGMRLIRKLHNSGATVSRCFDFYEESQRYLRDLRARRVALPEGADALLHKVDYLHECVSKDACQKFAWRTTIYWVRMCLWMLLDATI